VSSFYFPVCSFLAHLASLPLTLRLSQPLHCCEPSGLNSKPQNPTSFDEERTSILLGLAGMLRKKKLLTQPR